MKLRLASLLAAAGLLAAPAFAQTIAFVGFNADGTDNLAFVTFSDLAAGTTISFSDNERNASGWIDNNENGFTWTATSAITAGTIVTLDGIGGASLATATSNLGTIAAIAGAGTNLGIGNSDEAVFAFGGSYASPTFLAVIANDLLANTGSTANPAPSATSVIIVGDEDVMEYVGPRSGLATFADYLPYLTNSANWVTQDASGDQSADGITPDVPFNTTAFTVAIPEPSTYATLFAGATLAAVLWRRRPRKSPRTA